jgi:hypothetical protein
MSHARKRLAGAVALIGALAVAVAAHAAVSQSFTLTYSSTKPGTSTGFHNVDSLSDPANHTAGQEGKPKAGASRVVIRLAPGTKFDTTVPKRCTASIARIIGTRGTACRSSQVGSGTIVRDGRPSFGVLTEKVTAFNAKDSLILYLDHPQPGAGRQVMIGKLKGATLDTTVPQAGDGYRIYLTSFDVTIKPLSKRIDGHRRNYVTAPRTCPRSGFWKTVGTFYFTNGKKAVRTSSTSCA